MNRIECRFEDWDDTVLPRPVCHCMKREGVDCANGSYVKWCPDYEPKPQPDQSSRLADADREGYLRGYAKAEQIQYARREALIEDFRNLSGVMEFIGMHCEEAWEELLATHKGGTE